MDRGLIRELERWERGELPLEALEGARGARARSLAELHGRLRALGAGPVPSADVAWAELAPRLAARGGVVPLPVRRVPRALVAAAAAAALALALGLSAPRPLRHELLSFFEQVRSALGLEDGRSEPGTAPGLDTSSPAGSPVSGGGVPVLPEDDPGAALGGAEDEGDGDGLSQGKGDVEDEGDVEDVEDGDGDEQQALEGAADERDGIADQDAPEDQGEVEGAEEGDQGEPGDG